MSKQHIILIGGGGHCKACIDIIEQEGIYDIAGIVDTEEKMGQQILNYPVIATDNQLEELVKKYSYFLITLGQLVDANLRISLFNRLKELGATLPVVISPNAYVSPHASIDQGTIVMHHAVVNAGVTIGENNIINTHSTIEHDVTIGKHCHISTSTCVNGEVTIGDECFIGSNSVLIQGVKVGSKTTVGAGSTVINNLDSQGKYVGSPAKKLAK
jgi:sugar O-acyltransferase (sialic acid O-acetyltransferase NeuD family)